MASDLVLIPVQPSPYDVWAAAETIQLVREARLYKESLRAAFVINRMISNTAIGRDVLTALEQFPETPVLGTALIQRVVYAESAASGLSVIEAAPRSDAAKELRRLRSRYFPTPTGMQHEQEDDLLPKSVQQRQFAGCPIRNRSLAGGFSS